VLHLPAPTLDGGGRHWLLVRGVSLLENISEDGTCFLKVWSARCLNWPVVTRAHVPRQVLNILGMAAVLTNATMIAFVGSQFSHGAPRDL
jgi:hypothetical protein